MTKGIESSSRSGAVSDSTSRSTTEGTAVTYALRETAASYRKLDQVIEAAIAARMAEFGACRFFQRGWPPLGNPR